MSKVSSNEELPMKWKTELALLCFMLPTQDLHHRVRNKVSMQGCIRWEGWSCYHFIVRLEMQRGAKTGW